MGKVREKLVSWIKGFFVEAGMLIRSTIYFGKGLKKEEGKGRAWSDMRSLGSRLPRG